MVVYTIGLLLVLTRALLSCSFFIDTYIVFIVCVLEQKINVNVCIIVTLILIKLPFAQHLSLKLMSTSLSRNLTINSLLLSYILTTDLYFDYDIMIVH